MCVQRFGSGLRAVILTGSLARGEGTLSSDGTPGKLASDAEFILVSGGFSPTSKVGRDDASHG